MLQDIVIFERDERYTETGKPELDFRGLRGILPTGSAPLAIANQHDFTVAPGQWFDFEEVADFAEKMSGYRAMR